MKRLQRALAMLLLLALVLTGIPVVPVAAEEVAASGTCGDGLTWEVKDTTLIISGTGAMDNFTTTSQPWKDYRSTITSVVVQDGVTSIGKNAFYYCRKITEISLPDTVTTVAYRAFYKAEVLADVYYAGTMEQWDAISVDSECGTLLDAKLHMQTGFGLCGDGLRWDLLGGVLTVSGTGAMDNFTTATQPWKDFRGLITSVVIKEGVTSIGKNAFYYCRKITEISLPDTVTTVASRAFYKTEVLADVYFDGTQAQWDQISIAEENTYLTSAKLHLAANAELASGTCGDALTWSLSNQGVLTISGTGAMTDFARAKQPWYDYRAQIKSIVIGDGVTTIGTYAFYYCNQATSVTIPETITRIAKNAMLSCKKLNQVNYASSAAILGLITHPMGNEKLLGATLNTAEPVYKELQLTAPSKLIYQKNEPLDLSGMVVTLVDNNGNCVQSEDYFVLGYDAAALKTQTVTVVCQGLYTTFDVNVRVTGNCGAEGDNITFVLTNETLELTGTGKMADYARTDTPFFNINGSHRGEIKTVKVNEGITYLGKYAFYYLHRLVTVRLPLSLEKVGNAAFYNSATNTTANVIVNTYFAGTQYQWEQGLGAGKTETNTTNIAKNNLPLLNTTNLRFEKTAKVERIEITAMPKTEYVVGEALDTTGLEVTGYYDDGQVKVLDPTLVKVTGYVANNPATQVLNVAYASLNTTLTVKVSASGTCGATEADNVTWKLEENVLTISGQGAMAAYTGSTQPWKLARANFIKEIVVEEGVTNLGTYIGAYCNKLEKVSIPTSVTSIDTNAFYKNTASGVEVYYAGSQSQWNRVNLVTTGNATITNATIYFGKEDTALTGIAVTAPAKTAYWQGEELDLGGMTVTGTYSDGSTAQITEGYTVTGYSDYRLGEQEITVTYEGFTATFTVTVSEVFLVEMLLTPPAKTEYAYGEALNLNGMIVDVKYSNGKISRIAAGYQLSGYNANKVGEQTVTVTYQDVSATFTVTVAEPVITGLHVTLPTKTEYAWGEALDLTGMIVMAAYSDGSERVVTDYTLSGYDAYTSGAHTILVSYEGICVDFTVTVAAPVLTGITLTTPNKTEYWVGEALDLTGMIVTASYSDGTCETVTNYTVTGYDAAVIGGQVVTVTYEGMSASFPVQVKELYVIGLYVQAPAKTQYFLYEELDTTGMVVTAAYSDGNSVEITEGYVISGFDSTVPSEQIITVTYEGFTDTFTVTVEQIVLIGIYVSAPHKTEYAYGEELDLTGMTVTGNYSDGSSHGITDGYTVTGFDPEVVGQQWVSVTYEGCSMSFSVTVAEPVPEVGQLILDKVTGKGGDTVQVKLTLADNPGITCAKLKLTFDSSVLTLTEVTDGGILGEAVHKPELASPYTLCWANDLATQNFTANGTLVTLTFAIAQDAPAGEYPITLSYGTTNGDIMDAELMDVPFEAVNGSVTVEQTQQEEDDGVAKLVLSSVSATVGETVEVKLSIKNNPGITSAKLKLNFDSSVLTLTEVIDGGILGTAVHKPELASPYTLCWANDLATENFTQDGTLVTLRFTVAEDAPAGDYALTLSYGTTNGDIMDADLNDVAFTTVQGNVIVI